MKIFSVRTPYIININETGQTDGRIYIKLWKPNESEPSTQTYVLSKASPTTTQTEVTFNISPFVKDWIENKIEDVTAVDKTDYNYVNVKITRLYSTNSVDFTTLDTIEGIGVNGYNNFTLGVNQFKDGTEVQNLTNFNFGLFEAKTPIYYDRSRLTDYYIQLYVPSGSSYVAQYQTLSFASPTVAPISQSGILNIPITTNESKFNDGNLLTISWVDPFNNYVDLGNYKFIPVCEPILTPVICTFINRNGAVSQLTFFKMRTDTIDATSDKYNLMPSNWDYDVTQGIYRQHNFNAKQSIKLNTGFVTEAYNSVMQDLILSESVWLDGIPATVKTQSLEVKTQIRNKNINYELDFEYGFDVINSIV